jgi:hypothetical protein
MLLPATGDDVAGHRRNERAVSTPKRTLAVRAWVAPLADAQGWGLIKMAGI